MNVFETHGPTSFDYGGRSVGYIIRPGRGRSVKIVVNGPEAVEVRVPPRVSLRAVQAFVAEQAEWIVRTMAKQAKRPRVAPLTYATGETLYYLGKPCRLEVAHSVWKSVALADGVLRVTLANTANPARVKALVNEWFLTQSQAVFAEGLAEMVERFGDRIRREHGSLVMRSDEHPAGVWLTVRAMKTRWGSCSKDGHVTLSTELIHAPRRLIDYVIVHELCHLVHLNHSRAFYFQLARCLPDWEERRRELESRSWRQAQVPT
jgi:predicted metal-dependent hydrolase